VPSTPAADVHSSADSQKVNYVILDIEELKDHLKNYINYDDAGDVAEDGVGISVNEGEHQVTDVAVDVVDDDVGVSINMGGQLVNVNPKIIDFVVDFQMNKNWFYAMSQPNKCWTDDHIDVIFYYLRKKSKLGSMDQYRYTKAHCFFMSHV
ncbi:hypothetical protein EJD97_003216, partial [Solanum chilense]